MNGIDLYTLVPLFLLGPFVGIFSTFFGIGGGLLVVPALYFLLPTYLPQNVIGTSFAMIFLNSVINCRVYYKARDGLEEFNFKSAMVLGIFMGIGVLLGGELLNIFSTLIIKRIFGILLIILALKLIAVKEEQVFHFKFGLVSAGILGLVSGVLAGLTGLGGGSILVPILISFYCLPVQLPVVYSNFAMAFSSFIGTVHFSLLYLPTTVELPLSTFQIGTVNYAIAFLIVAGAQLTRKKGMELNKRIEKKMRSRIFAGLLFTISLKILLS